MILFMSDARVVNLPSLQAGSPIDARYSSDLVMRTAQTPLPSTQQPQNILSDSFSANWPTILKILAEISQKNPTYRPYLDKLISYFAADQGRNALMGVMTLSGEAPNCWWRTPCWEGEQPTC